MKNKTKELAHFGLFFFITGVFCLIFALIVIPYITPNEAYEVIFIFKYGGIILVISGLYNFFIAWKNKKELK